MKKFFAALLTFVLILPCGCTEDLENTETRFLLDTFLTLSADGDKKLLPAAFDTCAAYENEFSRTVENSTVSRLNRGEKLTVSDDVKAVLERGLYYGKLTDGKFDITICPVSRLWDFEKGIIPTEKDLKNALPKVDYRRVQTDGNTVFLNGAEIDLGGIAKGFIADRIAEQLQNGGARNGMVNFSSSIVIFGKKRDVRIRDPFFDQTYAATLTVQNTTVSTSGTYERSFTKDNKYYHHILDPPTGYGVETDLASATVICDSALEGDVLSTVCILYGLEKATRLIESTSDTEAVFIDVNGNLSYTDGLTEHGDRLILKEKT